MRKVAYSIAAIAFITLFAACKNDVETSQSTEAETKPSNLAVADIPEAENPAETIHFLYVTAPSGLSLREFNNLNSERLANMPYGTKVKVIKAEENATMTLAGVKGAMDEVEFNHKTGFAFTGYLSKFFPPERDISAKGYAAGLKKSFPKVHFTESTGGTASAPAHTETIMLPTTSWHEAYFIGQRLFDFPKEFTFPNPKGENEETIFDGKPKKGVWKSELQITRNANELQQIEYVYGSEKFDLTITIAQEGEMMKVSKTEVLK
jgi:hypothetical protein